MIPYSIHKLNGSRLTDDQVRKLTSLFRQLDDAEQGYEDQYGLRVTRPTDRDLGKWLRTRSTILAAVRKNGDILGFANSDKAKDYTNAGYVGALVVDKKYRGHGIGRAILHQAIRDNRRRRFKTILRVHLKNDVGNKLYASEGFVPTSQTMVASEKRASYHIRATINGILKMIRSHRTSDRRTIDAVKSGLREAIRRNTDSIDLRRGRRYRDDAFPGIPLQVSVSRGEATIHGIPYSGGRYDMTLSGYY